MAVQQQEAPPAGISGCKHQRSTCWGEWAAKGSGRRWTLDDPTDEEREGRGASVCALQDGGWVRGFVWCCGGHNLLLCGCGGAGCVYVAAGVRVRAWCASSGGLCPALPTAAGSKQHQVRWSLPRIACCIAMSITCLHAC
jgi:hypothetical protein